LFQKKQKVIGVESVPDAIKDAKANAVRNEITNCEFFVGDMKVVFNDDFIAQHGQPDVIITDPPRDGMHKDVIEQIMKNPAKVVYVSCNSATQARDLALMDENTKLRAASCRYVSANASRRKCSAVRKKISSQFKFYHSVRFN
jgi:23S rRNA (uracil1939-C5)-methyltransferase